MRALIIDNTKHKKTDELRTLKNRHSDIEIITTSNSGEIPGAINYAIKNKIKLIISSGGDGSLNCLVNDVMKLDKKKREKLIISVLPCGKANDLATRLGMPKNLERAFEKIMTGHPKKIDLITVNDKYFVTGGGLGVASEVIKENNKKLLPEFLHEKIYMIIVLKLFIGGYEGVTRAKIGDKEYKDLMIISIMNQPFIGKKFFLSPEAREDDSFFDLCTIKGSRNALRNLYSLNKIVRKKLPLYSWAKISKHKNLSISLDRKHHFMGDGELLSYSDKFDLSVVPKAITFVS